MNHNMVIRLLIILQVFLLTVAIFGQSKYTVNNQWTNAGSSDFVYVDIFDSTAALPHGIVVDQHNRVWIGSFGGFAPGIIIRNPDGTEAAFSPIDSVTVGGETFDVHSGCRGMALDQDGNVLYAQSNVLYRIDVNTGTGLARWESTKAALTKPAVDRDGLVFVGDVIGVSPISVLEPIFFFESQQFTLSPSAELARGLEVTSDGKHLWTGNLTAGGAIYHYATQDFVNYDIADSIVVDANGNDIFEFSLTTMDWGPDSTLWVSQETENPDLQTENSLVIFDFNTNEYRTLLMPPVSAGSFNGPRGVAFNAGGDTAYVASFNGSQIWQFARMATTDVRTVDAEVPAGFDLMQNYPNPFNPSTTITFRVASSERISLAIYNAIGQRVRTLVMDKTYYAGTHSVQWDGTDDHGNPVSSGVYVYRLIADNIARSKTMSLTR